MMHIDERIASFGKIDATPRLEVVDAYLAERNAIEVFVYHFIPITYVLNGRKVKL